MYHSTDYQNIFDNLPLAVCVVDFTEVVRELKNLPENLVSKIKANYQLSSNKLDEIFKSTKLTYYNYSLMRLFEWNDKETFPGKIKPFFNIRSRKIRVGILKALLQGESSYKTESAVKTLANKTAFIEITWEVIENLAGNFNEVLISFEDQTEKRAMSKTIKRLQNRLRAIFRNTVFGVGLIDGEKKIIESNQSLRKMLNYNEREMKKLTLDKIVTPEKRNNFNMHLGKVFKGTNKSFHMEEKLIDKNNGKKWCRFTVINIGKFYTGQLFAIVIVEDISDKKRAEQLYKEINETQKRIMSLSKFLLEVQERERGRIARELHDEIGQVLTAIKIEMQSVAKITRTEKIKRRMNEGIELVDHAVNTARNLSVSLRPSILDDIGLIPAIRWYIDRRIQTTDIKFSFNDQTYTKHFKWETEITCYRVIQEAVTNIIRHAEATNISIEIFEEKNKLKFKIIDDGKGFDAKKQLEKAYKGESMGLLSMIERVELVGGKLNIEYSNKKRGTVISAELPK
jgi:PAS domain S-box-containing protein